MERSNPTPAMQKALRLIAAKTAADHQGPHDMKQAAMLAEYLRDTMLAEGADDNAVVDRIISMLNNPTDFADEFAQVQGREAPPTIDGDGMAQPMPAQEEAPPEQTMPMPGMQPPPGSTTAKVAADNIAGKCPHCDSHTTGVIKEDGMSRCHNCNKNFQTPKVQADPIDSTNSVESKTAAEPELHDHEGLHVRDENSPSTMRWVDTNGRPIEVGKEYRMNSNRSDIPDFITVLGPGVLDPDTGEMGGPVIGDTLKYEITGEYGLNHVGDLTIEEFDDEEISFEPTNDGDDVGDEETGPNDMLDQETNSDRTMFEGSPEQTDLSKPTTSLASVVGRHARTDEFARPDAVGRRPDANDESFPLVDAPHPNKFSSREQFEEATSEWKKQYLEPALNYRAAKSFTSTLKAKIAKGEEVDERLWEKIESLGGPRYANDEVEGPFTEKDTGPNANEDWPSWRPSSESQPGLVGRGLTMHRPEGAVLHTWPVDRLSDEPELFHAEHMRNVGWNPESGPTGMFEIVSDGDGHRIDPNGSKVILPDGMTFKGLAPEDLELIHKHHPELREDEIKFSRVAGAEFNLMEQKEFIGEQGIARNADKLDLENTHYAETAMEEHFLFGL